MAGEGAAILWSEGPEAVPAGTTVDGLMEEENRNADGAEEVSEGGLVAKVNPEDPEPVEESALVTEKTNDDDVEGTGPLAAGTTLKVPAVAERVEAAAEARPRLGNAAGAEVIEAALGGCTANEPAQSKDYFSAYGTTWC